jgi:erythromycin esterase
MKRIAILSQLFFAFILMISCAKKEKTEVLTPQETIEQKLTKELDASLLPLAGADPSLPGTDLSIFSTLGQAKIVGMGEATHGTREFFQMKHRLFQYLVEKHGFRIFAFEYDFGACLILDEMLQTGQGSMRDYLQQSMGFWTWRTDEVLQFFQWMQDYNRNKPIDQKIHVVGVDCQMLQYGIPQLVKMLQQYDPNYAKSVNERLGSLAKSSLYPGATFSTIQALRSPVLPKFNEVGRELQERANDIAKATSPAYNQQIQHLFQTLTQAEIVQYSLAITPDNAVIFREKYMSDNTSWIFEQYGNVKIALWAHNEHVANNDRYSNISTPSQGGHLRNKYGNEYQIVGFSKATGQFSVFNITNQRLESMAINAPLKPSINYLFSLAKEKNYALKISDLIAKSNWQQHLASPQPFLSIGAGFDASKIEYYFNAIPLERYYNFVIHFNQTNATKLL